MKLTGKQTWVFEHPLFVNSAGTATGPKEKTGRSALYLIKPMTRCTVIKKAGKWLNAS